MYFLINAMLFFMFWTPSPIKEGPFAKRTPKRDVSFPLSAWPNSHTPTSTFYPQTHLNRKPPLGNGIVVAVAPEKPDLRKNLRPPRWNLSLIFTPVIRVIICMEACLTTNYKLKISFLSEAQRPDRLPLPPPPHRSSDAKLPLVEFSTFSTTTTGRMRQMENPKATTFWLLLLQRCLHSRTPEALPACLSGAAEWRWNLGNFLICSNQPNSLNFIIEHLRFSSGEWGCVCV